MADIRQMVCGGHWPTLLGAWLHLTVSFMVWLLIGALSLPMARALGLTGTDLSVLVALPLLGGAVLRVWGGWSCDWFGTKKTGVLILLGVGGLKGLTGSYDLGLWFFAGLGVCAWGTVFMHLRAERVTRFPRGHFPVDRWGQKNNVKCLMLNDKLVIH